MIARVQDSFRRLLQPTAPPPAEAVGLPGATVDDVDAPLGDDRLSPRAQAASRMGDPAASPYISPAEPDSSTDMSASVDTLAEQMLNLVDIVSAQEKDIKALKDQCRRLQEHDQAIMVAFSTFFHVLSVGRVAKAGEIAALLQNIGRIAEQEGRPKEAVAFLQDLARMVPGHADAESDA